MSYVKYDKYDTIPRDMLRPALCFLEPGESAWVPHAAIIVDAAGRAHVDLQCSILCWGGDGQPLEDAVRVRRGDSGWVLEINRYREFHVSAREYSEMSDARVVEVRVETYGTHGTRPAGT